MMRLVLLAAFPMVVCLAFHVPSHQWPTKTSTTFSLAMDSKKSAENDTFHAVSDTITTTSTAIASAVLGWSLAVQMVQAAPLVLPESSMASLSTASLVIAKGAFIPEAGYDDFSNGLTLPKYNVEVPEGREAENKAQSEDPAKLAQAQARAKEAAQKKAEAAAKKKEVQAQSKAEAEERARAKEELAAVKRKKQLENMNEEQRAKIEAYEAKKAANGGIDPSAGDNMKRMYGL